LSRNVGKKLLLYAARNYKNLKTPHVLLLYPSFVCGLFLLLILVLRVIFSIFSH